MPQTAAPANTSTYAEQVRYLASLPGFILSLGRPTSGPQSTVRALPPAHPDDSAGDLPVAIIDAGLRERLDRVEVCGSTISVGAAPAASIFEALARVKGGALTLLEAVALLTGPAREQVEPHRMIIEITDAVDVDGDVFASEIF